MNEYDEIDLIDLLFYCLKKWRWIVGMMLLFAILMGAYKYPVTIQENIEKQKLIAEQEKEAEKMEEAGTEASAGEAEPIVLEDPLSATIEFAVLGLLVGAFLTFLVLILKYAMEGKLQNVRNFKHDYGIPLLGTVSRPVKKRWFRFVDAWILKLEKGPYAKIPYDEQIRIAASNVQNAVVREEAKKIMLAGTMPAEEMKKVCSKLISEIEDVYFSKYKQVAFQAAALKEVKNYDGVLLIEKEGSSYAKYIRLEKELVEERGVKIVGAVVV